MDSQINKQLIVDAWKVFAGADPQAIAALFTEDAEWIAPEGNATAVALSHTSHMIGQREIANFIAVEFQKMFRDVKVEFLSLHAYGNFVVLEERMQATLMSGRAYDNTYCFIFELEGGHIKRVREYMNTLKGWRMVFGDERELCAATGA